MVTIFYIRLAKGGKCKKKKMKKTAYVAHLKVNLSSCERYFTQVRVRPQYKVSIWEVEKMTETTHDTVIYGS